jgi:ribonuclease VapC
LARLDIEVVDMTTVAGECSRDACARFGKGVGSPGVLDYGDTLSYGVARAADEPLLFTGNDLPETDIPSAL